MKVARHVRAREAFRTGASTRSPWLRTGLAAALVLAVACGDSSEPELGQDAATVLVDGGVDAAVMVPGQAGGNQGGSIPGAAGGTTGSGTMSGAGGMPGMTGMNPSRPDAGRPDAGRPLSDAGAGPADTGMAMPVGDGGDPFAEVRQVCVDTINMYRATLSLPPLARANAMQEACSDEGAKYDGDLNRGKPAGQVVGHQSTRNRSAACAKVGFGAQDACPNWGVGPRTGNATLADAIKRCLGQMWAEGMPPIPVADCIKDQAAGGCFLTHGHWINMSSTSSKVVACGFYNVEGTTYWLNQDFAAR